MRITKLFDLGVLSDLLSLKTLRLDWMRNVTSLPSFAWLARLDNVELDTMKGLTDLSPVAAAPALRRLCVTGMPQLTAESFRLRRSSPARGDQGLHRQAHRERADQANVASHREVGNVAR
jgi:hypothetical protein